MLFLLINEDKLISLVNLGAIYQEFLSFILYFSFQTKEDSFPNEFLGDINSIMKVMIDKPKIDI